MKCFACLRAISNQDKEEKNIDSIIDRLSTFLDTAMLEPLNTHIIGTAISEGFKSLTSSEHCLIYVLREKKELKILEPFSISDNIGYSIASPFDESKTIVLNKINNLQRLIVKQKKPIISNQIYPEMEGNIFTYNFFGIPILYDMEVCAVVCLMKKHTAYDQFDVTIVGQFHEQLASLFHKYIINTN